MEHRFRIINRTLYFSGDSDDKWSHKTEDTIWSGEDLPSDLDQEIAIVESIGSATPIPYDVAPGVHVENQAVLQELYIKKVRRVGMRAHILAWRDFEPDVEEESGYYHGWFAES